MPIYEYKCCGKSVEHWAEIKHDVPMCKKCGKEMKKLVSNTTFVLSGTGWANTGYTK